MNLLTTALGSNIYIGLNNALNIIVQDKLRTRILQGTGKTKWGIVNKNYDCLSLRIMGNSIILPLAQSAMIIRDPGSTATPIGL